MKLDPLSVTVALLGFMYINQSQQKCIMGVLTQSDRDMIPFPLQLSVGPK